MRTAFLTPRPGINSLIAHEAAPPAVRAHAGPRDHVAFLTTADGTPFYEVHGTDAAGRLGASYYAPDGALLTRARQPKDSGYFYDWKTPEGDPLVCLGGGNYCGDVAIDASRFPYRRSRPRTPGACTTAEIHALAKYERTHLPNCRLTPWRATVSPACAACAFGEAARSPVAAILYSSEVSPEAFVEGCYEVVSGSEECGRREAQVQQCMTAACRGCTTSEEHDACTHDPGLADVACGEAIRQRNAACAHADVQRCRTRDSVVGPVTALCGP